MKKKVLIITGSVMMYCFGIFGGAMFGYNVGYDDAMAEVETRVIEGLERFGEMFDVGDE